ncbi:MAG TPA: ester cyclase [Longimicrobium sp.]|jgi:predicted ester cyclase
MSMRDLQGDELKLRQGRWFHLEDDGTQGSPGVPYGPGTLTAPKDNGNGAAEQLAALAQQGGTRFDPFVAVVSGQMALTQQRPAQYPATLPEAWEGLQGLSKRDQAIAMMYRYIELENSRDYHAMEKIFHPTEFRSKTYFGTDPISPKAHTRMLKGLFRAFPDWFMVINEIVSADDQSCVALITGRGTQYEEFNGRPPADHQIAIPTLHAIKVRDGLIVEHRHINPFENIFANQIMAPLTEDIMAVRAQQGFDSGMAERAYQVALEAGADDAKLGLLKSLIETKRRQCQVLLKGTLRRCTMIAPEGEIYCEHHQKHGYGVDGIE